LTMQKERTENILLISPPPLKYGDWVREEKIIAESRSIAEGLRKVAERLGMAFADAAKWELALTYDGVHLSEKGQEAFARRLGSIIKQKYPLT